MLDYPINKICKKEDGNRLQYPLGPDILIRISIYYRPIPGLVSILPGIHIKLE